jgi:hypothetical protein
MLHKKNFNKKYKNFEQYFQAVTLVDVFAQVKSSSAFEALVVNSDNLIRGTLKNSFLTFLTFHALLISNRNSDLF